MKCRIKTYFLNNISYCIGLNNSLALLNQDVVNELVEASSQYYSPSFLVKCSLNQSTALFTPLHLSYLDECHQSPTLEQLLPQRHRLDIILLKDVVLKSTEVLAFEEHFSNFVLDCI